MELEELQYNAERYRAQYNMGLCSREIAKENIMPYLNEINKRAVEIAKKYNKKPKKITFSYYIR